MILHLWSIVNPIFGTFFMIAEFGEKLESLRKGMTQRQYAARLGVPLTTYTNWINGVSSPKAEAIVSICSILGVSADWLLGLPERGKSGDGSADALKVAALKGAIQAILDKF
ncbi:MAG: helix-turn-helix transcriptional regulator [Kiritimatiellae bacterium]|nr:helix-turn-helix transcriptional regulator [Kiritimatiellia bacterium]